MDILTAMIDVNDFILSATDECQLNVNNLGHEWHTRACDYQTTLDATGDVTSAREHPTATLFFRRIFTIQFITNLLSEMKPIFRQCRK